MRRKCLKRAFCIVTTNQLAHALIEPLPKAKLDRTELADKDTCRLSIRKQVSTNGCRFKAPEKKIYQIKSQQNKEGLPK